MADWATSYHGGESAEELQQKHLGQQHTILCTSLQIHSAMHPPLYNFGSHVLDVLQLLHSSLVLHQDEVKIRTANAQINDSITCLIECLNLFQFLREVIFTYSI